MTPGTGRTLALALVALAAGCGGPPQREDAPDQGLVLCTAGAGGFVGEVGRIRRGLLEGGVPFAIEEFHWSRGTVLGDQINLEANRAQAAALARRIETYQDAHPGRPVHLVGVSAGTGILVWALEALVPGRRVDGAVLIASSLEQHYNLGPALAKLRGRMHSFYSPLDMILAMGVPLTGTVDRSGGISGGLARFVLPDDADAATRALYEECLVQHGWTPGDMLLGHLGDHLGATSPSFVRERIAPIVWGNVPCEPTPDEAAAGAGAAD